MTDEQSLGRPLRVITSMESGTSAARFNVYLLLTALLLATAFGMAIA